jgi:hypothetical protein
MKSLVCSLLTVVVLFNLSCLNRSDSFGKVLTVTGDASVFSKKDSKWNPIQKSTAIHFGDTLQSRNGGVAIQFRNKSKITLDANTKVVIIDSVDKKNSYIFPIVFSGGILSEVKHRHPNDFIYIVYTPVSYAQAKGSHFYVSYIPATNTSNIQVFDGDIIVYNTSDFSEPVELSPGFTTTVSNSNIPSKPKKLNYIQFQKIGYMFTPEVCEHYQIVFGFPIVPIPVQVNVFAQTPVEIDEGESPEPITQEDLIEMQPEPKVHHKSHEHHSNVSVNVNIDAPLPFIPLPVPFPGGPGPRHGYHQAPGPVLPPPLPIPVPGPRPRQQSHDYNNSDHRDDGNNQQRVAHHPPLPPPIFPVPHPTHNPFKH